MGDFELELGSLFDTGVGGVIGEAAEELAPTATTTAPAIVRGLWILSSSTLVVDLSAGLYHPPTGPLFGSHSGAYYAILVAILALVAVEMTTAYLLSRSAGGGHGQRLLAFGKCLLCFATVLLLVAVAVGGCALLAVKA